MVGFYKQSYIKIFLINMPNFEIGLPRNALCYLKECLPRNALYTLKKGLKQRKLQNFQDGRFYKHAYTKIFLKNMGNFEIGLWSNALCY